MPKTNTRIVQGLLLAGALAASAAAAPAAYATSSPQNKTYNNATVDINGGNAASLSACVNYAQVKIKHGKPAQNNFCKNFASATGGTVLLKNTSVLIAQTGSGTGTNVNNATVNISGGDAIALAGCVNFLQGTSDATQKNVCKNTSVAKGGDVILKNSDITIIQG